MGGSLPIKENSSEDSQSSNGRIAPLQIEGLDNFGAVLNSRQASNEGERVLETECLLKTKSDNLRKHWLVILSNELYGYKDQKKTT
jgi:hypothetical protein